MQFGDPIASGLFLVREALRSPNYTPNVSGWTVNADGSAEFNNVLIRGGLATGPPRPYVEIPANSPTVNFYPANSIYTQILPAFLGSTGANFTDIRLAGPTNNAFSRRSHIDLDPGDAGNAARITMRAYDTTGIGLPNTELLVIVGGSLDVTSVDGSDSSFWSGLNVLNNPLTVYNTELILGDVSGTHVRGNPNSFRAFNAAAVSTLYFNWGGGDIRLGNLGSTNIQINGNGIQALNVNAATSLLLNNGGGTVFCGGSVVAATQFICNGTTLDNQLSTAGGTIIGTAILGNGNLQWRPPAAGGTANVNAIVQGGGDYRLRLISSTRRHKENIRDLTEYSPEQILELRPRWFQRNDEIDQFTDKKIGYHKNNPWYAGFIAEEADEIGLDSFVTRNPFVTPDKSIEGFAYDQFAAVAHQIVLRSHQKRIESLEARILKLEAIINGLPRGLGR